MVKTVGFYFRGYSLDPWLVKFHMPYCGQTQEKLFKGHLQRVTWLGNFLVPTEKKNHPYKTYGFNSLCECDIFPWAFLEMKGKGDHFCYCFLPLLISHFWKPIFGWGLPLWLRWYRVCLGSIPGSSGKGMATHSSILAWKIPWTEETTWLQSMWLQRVRHDWAVNFHFNEPQFVGIISRTNSIIVS